MTKNIMPEILKSLGVDYAEKFKLHNQEYTFGDDLFFFDKEQGLVHICHDGSLDRLNNVLYDILNGSYEIAKLPWEPSEGDIYYYPSVYGYKSHFVCEIWSERTFDYAMKALGMVYRTREEAEEHFAEDFKKLTGEKLEE